MPLSRKTIPLQRIRLSEALKKLQLKAPSIIVCERRNVESPPSPTSTLAFIDDSGSDSDNDTLIGSSSQCSNVPADVQKGCFAVYVGEESKRYVIPVKYLKTHVFETLLSRAEEEFGFSNMGAIRFPCETVLFEHLLWLLNREDPSVDNLEMEELLKFYQ
ncbi:indole-3-acetic acid-induced protein ARG7-like [Magnolia sinica]|uniref:indole-3-acetic acid-induced protein ARG7-like n=1 Tax=Magnolia sinica TaxID=86752 RepID=UPI0026583354|nr:indole-3-acetic acid-induced protein ARG7-like [Magnolia sinica]